MGCSRWSLVFGRWVAPERITNCADTEMPGKGYRELEVWTRSKTLAVHVYRETRTFPVEERFGLTSQMRRAAISIPANIAEGEGRLHSNDFIRHLSIARGSLAELETELEIAVEVGLLTKPVARSLWRAMQTIGRMLTALIRAVDRDQRRLQDKAQSSKKNPRRPLSETRD